MFVGTSGSFALATTVTPAVRRQHVTAAPGTARCFSLAAYASELFAPLLTPGGALAPTTGAVIGTGAGRGITLLYVLLATAIMLLAVTALGARLPQLVDDSPDATPDDLIGLRALGRGPLIPAQDSLPSTAISSVGAAFGGGR